MASEAILRELDNENVDVSGVYQSEHMQAGYGTILLAPSGERTILSFHGKGPKHGDPHLQLDRIVGADWVYPSALHSIPLLEEVISRAKESGVKVMFNPDSKELEQPAKLKSLLEDIEVLCVNRDEAKLLVHGETSEELVRHFLNFVPVVIVSDGPNGVVASDGKTIIRAGMYQDVKVIDRLGAGDAFASGFLSQWSQGKSLKESIVFASANSTSVVTKIGAKAGILHKGFKLHEMPLMEKAL
jgi:sugar/nucleoside kinase (ribokinase family)